MNYYIGIDLGTSSCKGILTDRDGKIYRKCAFEYPVLYPRDGWTEQEPKEWLSAAKKVLATLSKGLESDIRGLSFGGQMHGLVTLDKHDEVIRPAILWNDGRTDKETKYLNQTVGQEALSRLTGNIAFAGFTAPKILWMKKHEPELFAKIAKICLPKDYLVYCLTGAFSTDPSDASGTLLFDVERRCWCAEMCAICDVRPEWLPQVHESYEVVGRVMPEYGLPNCIVTAGAGDNAAAAIGTGCVKNGDCNISIGTSGTLFIAEDGFSVPSKNALHSFAHANGRYHLMGCILSAASCRRWWLENVLKTDDYDADEKEASEAPESDLIFLPYLAGERSPHNDVSARGAILGLSMQTTRAQISRAVMEGVAFALRDCLEEAIANGARPTSATLCGGGAKSKCWRQIFADVLNLPIRIPCAEEGPSFGAAILAMTGAGEYAGVGSAAEKIVKFSKSVLPDFSRVLHYNEKYTKYHSLYPALKAVLW